MRPFTVLEQMRNLNAFAGRFYSASEEACSCAQDCLRSGRACPSKRSREARAASAFPPIVLRLDGDAIASNLSALVRETPDSTVDNARGPGAIVPFPLRAAAGAARAR